MNVTENDTSDAIEHIYIYNFKKKVFCSPVQVFFIKK